MNAAYSHDFDHNDVCRKCHAHKSNVKMLNLCPVMSKEEVAQFRSPAAESYIGGNTDA